MVDGYRIRQYIADDKDAILSLYSEVFGGGSTEWFDWKYEDNPYTDEPPIIVAKDESGELVGARPHFALPLRYGDETGIGLEPCDTMVHPDHRRRGIFTEMTTAAIKHYSTTDHWCFFNFPNRLSRPADKKLGWRFVGNAPVWLRINDTKAVAQSMAPQKLEPVGSLARPLVASAHSLNDSRRPLPSDVARLKEPPIEFLAALNQLEPSNGLHVDRDDQYLEWRFDRPDIEYTYYVVEAQYDVGAAIITSTQTNDDGATTMTIVDSIGTTGWGDLLTAVLMDHSDSDMIRAFQADVPKSALQRAGFLDSESLPLSAVYSPPELLAYPLGDSPLSDEELLDLSNWRLSFATWDVA